MTSLSERTSSSPALEVTVPERQGTSYEALAAWYSGFSFCEHYRKVRLAQCREIVRAEFAERGEKLTESRLDDLGRLHDLYLSYLAQHIEGRMAWEKTFLEHGGMA